MSRLKRRILVSIAVVAAMLGAGAPWLLGNGDSPRQTSRSGQGIALAAPPLQQILAFPEDDAGFSAYLNVGALSQTFQDLEKFSSVCTGIPDAMSGNHLLCHITGISPAQVNLYVDTAGWIVAFTDLNQMSTMAGVWTGDQSNPVFVSPTAAFDEAIKRAVVARGGDYEALKPDTGYFHFQKPAASEILVMVKMKGGEYFFALPVSSTLFEVSATVFGGHSYAVRLDENPIVQTPCCGTAERADAFVCTTEPPAGRTPCPGPVDLGEGHKIRHDQTLISSAVYVLWTGAGP